MDYTERDLLIALWSSIWCVIATCAAGLAVLLLGHSGWTWAAAGAIWFAILAYCVIKGRKVFRKP